MFSMHMKVFFACYYLLAAAPVAARGFVFKGEERDKKHRLKPSKDLNLKIMQPKLSRDLSEACPKERTQPVLLCFFNKLSWLFLKTIREGEITLELLLQNRDNSVIVICYSLLRRIHLGEGASPIPPSSPERKYYLSIFHEYSYIYLSINVCLFQKLRHQHLVMYLQRIKIA